MTKLNPRDEIRLIADPEWVLVPLVYLSIISIWAISPKWNHWLSAGVWAVTLGLAARCARTLKRVHVSPSRRLILLRTGLGLGVTTQEIPFDSVTEVSSELVGKSSPRHGRDTWHVHIHTKDGARILVGYGCKGWTDKIAARVRGYLQ